MGVPSSAPGGPVGPLPPERWARTLSPPALLALGLLLIVVALAMLVVDSLAVVLLSAFFGAAILVMGLSALLHGVGGRHQPAWIRGLQLAFGLLSLLLAGLYLADLRFAFVFSVLLFGFGLVFSGLALSATATPAGLPPLARAWKLVTSVLLILFGIVTVLFPRIGALVLVAFAVVGLVLYGSELLVLGLRRRTPLAPLSPGTGPAE